MNIIILIIKGFIIGVANVIPGVSGGTLAITLGIYEKLISSISHFFKNFKENLKFLLPIGIGMVLSILVLSKLVNHCLNKYTLATILFFIGLIIGGIPLLTKKIKNNKKSISNIIILLITFSLVIILSLLKENSVVSLDNMNISGYLLLFGVGVIAAGTMIIPGISGSLVLLAMGYYEPITGKISSLLKFNNFINDFTILCIFGLGVLIGIILISKALEYLFKKHEIKTYYGVLGFVLASIITIFISAEGLVLTIPQILIGSILLGLGISISYKLGK